jgi:putative inorganic carbon (hco3(-)) transporter
MRQAGPVRSSKPSLANFSLLVLLLLLTIGITYLLSKSDDKTGYIVLIGIIGAAFTIFCMLLPIFGFYFTIVVSVFFADIERFARLDIPLGTYIDFLVFLTFLGIVLKKLFLRESFWKNCNHPILYAYLVMVIYSVIEIFNPNAESRALSLLILRRFFAILVFLYCSIQLFTDVKAIQRFIKVWILLAFILALYGCYQEWAGYPGYEMSYIFSDAHLTDLYSLDNGNYRKFSFLSDPTAFGILMAAVALINVILIMTMKKKTSRIIILSVSTLFMLLSMSYSGTRTAYGTFVAGIALYILMTLNNLKTLVFTLFAVMVFVLLIFGPFYGNSTLNRVRTTFHFSTDASLQVRDQNRKRIQPYLHDHPIGGGLGSTGLGTTSGGSSDAASRSTHPLAGFPTDSGFLRMGLEYGWIGLIIQCVLFFIVLQQGIHAFYNSSDPWRKILLMTATISIFSYVLSNYAQVAIGPLPGAFLFYPMIAVIIRLRQIETSLIISNKNN